MSTGGLPAPAPPAPPAGDQGQAVPWGTVTDGQTWQIGDKPWFETAIAEPDVREAIAAKKYAHPGVLAKSYVELERLNASRDDSKMVRIPDENAKPEDLDAFYTKLGRPTTPEGYKDVKWGENADPKMVEFATGLAFELGLPPKAAETLAAKWNTFVAGLVPAGPSAEQAAQANAAALTEIKAAWQGDFEANQVRGRQVLTALGKAGFSDADMQAVESQVGIAPVLKMLATIGKLTGEGTFLETPITPGPTDPANMTPEQAKGEIVKRTADPAFQKTYMSATEPGHKEAMALMESLYKKAGAMVTG